MIPRLRFRVRTYLIAVALLAPLLFGVIEVGRHGGLRRFRAYHAWRARDYRRTINYERRELERLSKFLPHGVPCPARPPVSSLANVVDYYRGHVLDLELRAMWHEVLSLFWEPMPMGGAET